MNYPKYPAAFGGPAEQIGEPDDIDEGPATTQDTSMLDQDRLAALHVATEAVRASGCTTMTLWEVLAVAKWLMGGPGGLDDDVPSAKSDDNPPEPSDD